MQHCALEDGGPVTKPLEISFNTGVPQQLFFPLTLTHFFLILVKCLITFWGQFYFQCSVASKAIIVVS